MAVQVKRLAELRAYAEALKKARIFQDNVTTDHILGGLLLAQASFSDPLALLSMYAPPRVTEDKETGRVKSVQWAVSGEALTAFFRASGGSYKILQWEPTEVEVEFYHPALREPMTLKMTMREAALKALVPASIAEAVEQGRRPKERKDTYSPWYKTPERMLLLQLLRIVARMVSPPLPRVSSNAIPNLPVSVDVEMMPFDSDESNGDDDIAVVDMAVAADMDPENVSWAFRENVEALTKNDVYVTEDEALSMRREIVAALQAGARALGEDKEDQAKFIAEWLSSAGVPLVRDMKRHDIYAFYHAIGLHLGHERHKFIIENLREIALSVEATPEQDEQDDKGREANNTP